MSDLPPGALEVIELHDPQQTVPAKRLGPRRPDTAAYVLLEEPFLATDVAKGDVVICEERDGRIPRRIR